MSNILSVSSGAEGSGCEISMPHSRLVVALAVPLSRVPSLACLVGSLSAESRQRELLG
jgi:hypothetical protein